MDIPGFTAEVSVYSTRGHYRTSGAAVFRNVIPSASVDCRDDPCDGTMACAETSGCKMTSDGTRLITSFKTRVRDLTVTGVGHADLRGPGKHLTLLVDRAGATVFSFESTLSDGGTHTATWRYGVVVGGVREAMLVTRDGNRVEGAVNGRKLVPSRSHVSSLRFADGSLVPQPKFPAGLRAALQELPGAVQAALASCQLTRSIEYNDFSASPRSILASRVAIAPASNGGTSNAYGVAPRIDDPGSSAACKTCILEAYGAAAACGIGCGLSFGFACGCVLGIPLLFVACHTPGSGAGQGCCPVACGPTHTTLGLDVVYQCCYGGDSCLDSSRGTCCGPNLQACNRSTCCPSNAPCRDAGICCPTDQNTCLTASGQVCCDAGEECMNGVCCPSGSTVCTDGTCCPTTCAFGSCCVGGTCCYPPNHICGNTCCSPFNACCNGVCCANDEFCVSGNCCQATQACGSVCCASGEFCQDPSTGTCTTCPPGTTSVLCTNQTGAEAGGCCPPGVSCCNGQCCPYASDSGGPITCCSPVTTDAPPFNNGEFGCHHTWACIA